MILDRWQNSLNDYHQLSPIIMKLHHLRDFIAVAETGGIRSAARELGLTQPSLTKSIQQLEEELETPLFERSARGAALTAYGQAFLVRARAAAHELTKGREELRQMRGSKGGTVSVAVSSVASLIFLPSALAAFRRKYPDADVRVLEGTYPIMLPALRDGSVDFCVGPFSSPPQADEFVIEELFANHRCVAGRVGHPLGHATTLAELAHAPWIVTGVIGPHGREFDEIFHGQNLPAPKARTRCESMIALLSLLAGSDALTFLPYQWTSAPVTRTLLAEIKLTETIPGPSTCLIRRSGLPLTPAADALATIFRREATYYRNR